MKMVVFGHSAQLSGAELFTARLLAGLSAGSVVAVLGEPGPLVTVLQSEGARTLVLPLPSNVSKIRTSTRSTLSWLNAALGSVFFVFRLRRLMLRLNPPVVYSISAKAHLLLGIASLGSRWQFVVHLHDTVPRGFKGALLKAVIRVRADRIIANSDWTRKSSGFDSSRCVVVPCFVGWPQPPERGWSRNESRIRLAVVARISPWKGQELALRALALLQATRPDLDLHLDIVGSAMFGDDAAYLESIEALASSLGVEKLISFRGFVSDLRSVYMNTDLLLHTSVLPEPFGQSIIEAMSFGCIPIVADSGGAADLIENLRSGVAYQMGNASALAGAILLAVNDLGLRRELSRGAYTRSRQYALETLRPAVLAAIGL